MKTDKIEKFCVWFYKIMYGVIVIGAILYMASNMGNYNSLKELFFWSLLLLTIGIRELSWIIGGIINEIEGLKKKK